MNCIQILIPDKPGMFNTKHQKSSCGDFSCSIKTAMKMPIGVKMGGFEKSMTSFLFDC